MKQCLVLRAMLVCLPFLTMFSALSSEATVEVIPAPAHGEVWRWDGRLGEALITRAPARIIGGVAWGSEYSHDGRVLVSAYDFTLGPCLRAPGVDAIVLFTWGGDECPPQPVVLVARRGEGVEALRIRREPENAQELARHCRHWRLTTDDQGILFTSPPHEDDAAEVWRLGGDGAFDRQ